MMSQRWRLLAVMCWLVLSGCAVTPRIHPLAHTPMHTDSSAWPLLSPAALGATQQVTQLLRGEFGEQQFNLRCVVTVNAEQLSVIGLTSMGMRAFTLRYDGTQLSEERAPQLPDALQAARLLNDLQLAYWPLPALQQAWQPLGAEVSEPYPGTRRLRRAGKLLAEVHYAADPWHGRVWLRHIEHGYNLYIESSALEPRN